MTKDEIIFIAKQVYGSLATKQDFIFGEMIAAAQRKKCAKYFDDSDTMIYQSEVASAIRAMEKK